MLRTIAFAALFIAPAQAADRKPLSRQLITPAQSYPAQSYSVQSYPAPECMCRLRSGRRVPLGTRTCLRVGEREYTAECRLSQNVSTWREIAKGCPVS